MISPLSVLFRGITVHCTPFFFRKLFFSDIVADACNEASGFFSDIAACDMKRIGLIFTKTSVSKRVASDDRRFVLLEITRKSSITDDIQICGVRQMFFILRQFSLTNLRRTG